MVTSSKWAPSSMNSASSLAPGVSSELIRMYRECSSVMGLNSVVAIYCPYWHSLATSDAPHVRRVVPRGSLIPIAGTLQGRIWHARTQRMGGIVFAFTWGHAGASKGNGGGGALGCGCRLWQ